MNDLKYVVINIICFLMMSCTQVIFGSSQQPTTENCNDSISAAENIVQPEVEQATVTARSQWAHELAQRRARRQEQNVLGHLAAARADLLDNDEVVRPRQRRPRLDDFIAFEGQATPQSRALSQDGLSPRSDLAVPSRQEVESSLGAVQMS
jgi:hypothetical protein